MKLRIGMILWVLALGVSGLQYVLANYTLSATGYRYAAVKVVNAQSSYVCLGPAAWTASGHIEEWSAVNEDNSESWKNAPQNGGLNVIVDYKSQMQSGCDNPNGVSDVRDNGFTIYPTGLYGAFVSYIKDNNKGEWYHDLFELPVRSMPLGWTVTGSI